VGPVIGYFLYYYLYAGQLGAYYFSGALDPLRVNQLATHCSVRGLSVLVSDQPATPRGGALVLWALHCWGRIGHWVEAWRRKNHNRAKPVFRSSCQSDSALLNLTQACRCGIAVLSVAQRIFNVLFIFSGPPPDFLLLPLPCKRWTLLL